MRYLTGLLTLAALASPASAHFIWLVPETQDSGRSIIHVRFGEDASDDGTEFLNRLKGIQLQKVSGTDAALPLTATSNDSGISCTTQFDHEMVVVTSHDLGVMDRGDNVFRLKYFAKAGPSVSDPAWRKAKSADDIRLDLLPVLKDGKLRIKVRFDGKLVDGAEVKATRPGMEDFEGKTNAKGVVTFDVEESGVHSIRARHIDAVGGEVDGKKFAETRYYSTVAVEVAQPIAQVAKVELQPLPLPVTSFGAAIIDDWLFMYGGHTGDAHSYSKTEQSNQLTKLNLKSGEWSTVIEGPHLQGLALVAHANKLYRIGGFTAENSEGEDHNLMSKDSVACFNPGRGSWEALPALPEPRSSHDAAVVGDAIYVVGGWAMNGDEDEAWHTTAWKMDLSANKLKWEAIATPPFRRRALALAAHNDKLFVVGGMQDQGGPTTGVAIYDPANDEWDEGPSLFVKAAPPTKDGEEKPRRSMSSGNMAGFGASAFATGGSLYVTTVQGNLQKLSADGSTWQVISTEVSPRFFHRLLPMDNKHLVVVGGSNMSIGKFEEVEVINVQPGE